MVKRLQTKRDFLKPSRNNGHYTKFQALIQPNIGLDSEVRHWVVEILNNTLANEAILTQKTRSAYWNVTGASFIELRTLFEFQYNQLNGIIDEISKRARVLGGHPIGSFEEFLKDTRLSEQPADIPGIMSLLADHEASIRFLREDARKCTEEYEDEGSFKLLVNTMRLHEKMAWILRSYIEPEITLDEIQGNKL
jgi:starvation-inducible DNA-binding protein